MYIITVERNNAQKKQRNNKMKNDEYTYDELLNAAMTQTATTAKIKEDIETLKWLKMLASARRRDQAFDQLNKSWRAKK